MFVLMDVYSFDDQFQVEFEDKSLKGQAFDAAVNSETITDSLMTSWSGNNPTINTMTKIAKANTFSAHPGGMT